VTLARIVARRMNMQSASGVRFMTAPEMCLFIDSAAFPQ
jgi:hypothetical protein